MIVSRAELPPLLLADFAALLVVSFALLAVSLALLVFALVFCALELPPLRALRLLLAFDLALAPERAPLDPLDPFEDPRPREEERFEDPR